MSGRSVEAASRRNQISSIPVLVSANTPRLDHTGESPDNS